MAMALLALLGALSLVPAGAQQIGTGPSGGTVWQVRIPNRSAPAATRPTVFYLPPGTGGGRRYPVVFFLHGFPGSPYQFVDGLRLAQTADRGIASGRLRPFVAVVPPAGYDVHNGEWAGIWEDFLVRDVVPWVDAHLPVERDRSAITLAGLSAGGYGAVDIGLRHPRLFGTLEAWSGWFRSSSESRDPSYLVRRDASLLRSLRTRFFLSCGTTHDRLTAAATRAFSAQLRALRLPHELWLAPGGHDGALWRRQLPAALAYAVGSYAGSRMRTIVPEPGAERISSLPATLSTRSS
jgi:enterochelin esterase-like enzyme